MSFNEITIIVVVIEMTGNYKNALLTDNCISEKIARHGKEKNQMAKCETH